jgi:GNAT superfamily N-acetyltransferase
MTTAAGRAAAGGSQPVPVGPARPDDAAQVAAAVTALLRELRGDPGHAVRGIERAAADLISDSRAGGVLVAREASDRRVVGVLAYSLQPALRLAGTYCAIQELWVEPAFRSGGVGARLIDDLARRCADRGIERVEVCLPSPAFPDYPRTLGFYQRRGFRALGPRMVRDLP